MLTEVRAVLLAAGVSFTAVFLFVAGLGFNLAGIGAGPYNLTSAVLSSLPSLTLRRLTSRGLPVRVPSGRRGPIRYVAVDGHARDPAARADRRRGRERRGCSCRVGFGWGRWVM